MEPVDYPRFILAFGFVVGLIWFAAWIAKRFGLDAKMRGLTRGPGRLQIVDALHFDPKRRLVIVKVDGREYLIAIAGDTIALLDQLRGEQDALGLD